MPVTTKKLTWLANQKPHSTSNLTVKASPLHSGCVGCSPGGMEKEPETYKDDNLLVRSVRNDVLLLLWLLLEEACTCLAPSLSFSSLFNAADYCISTRGLHPILEDAHLINTWGECCHFCVFSSWTSSSSSSSSLLVSWESHQCTVASATRLFASSP